MTHKIGFKIFDRTLRNFRSDQRQIGGDLALLAGDYRQTLPVIPR